LERKKAKNEKFLFTKGFKFGKLINVTKPDIIPNAIK